MDSTRSQTELRLIGHPNDDIPGQRLLPQRQVLQLFSYYHKDKAIHESAGFVAAKDSDFWNRTRIPTKQRYHIIAHIEKLFKTYCKLKKNKGVMRWNLLPVLKNCLI